MAETGGQETRVSAVCDWAQTVVVLNEATAVGMRAALENGMVKLTHD